MGRGASHREERRARPPEQTRLQNPEAPKNKLHVAGTPDWGQRSPPLPGEAATMPVTRRLEDRGRSIRAGPRHGRGSSRKSPNA